MKTVIKRKYRIVQMVIFLSMTGFSFLHANPLSFEIKNGWKFRQIDSTNWYPATVPGNVHTDLLANKLIEDPFYRLNERKLQWIDKTDWVYETSFNLSQEFVKKENVELNFSGLDTYADVYLNDQKILSADNMFLDWSVDCKSIVKPGENKLRIYFHSPIKKGLELLKEYGFRLLAINDQAQNGGLTSEQIVSPFIRKAPYHFGWDWGPRFVTSGIWKPVTVLAWDNVKIEDFYVKQESLSDKLAVLNGQLQVQSTKNQMANIEILINGKTEIKKEIQLKVGNNDVFIPFQIEKPKRWWSNGLGKPNLYDIQATISAGNSSDCSNREIGLRTLRLIQKKDSAGHTFYFELNGIPVFAKGENHIPNDMFLNRVTKDVYDWEINTAVKSNLNMLRVWGGGIYEDDYFYHLCDKYGIMVWQDFMFACSLYPGNKEFLESVTNEADYQIKRLRNHPSIALWCGNNEIDVAWQQYNPKGGWGWKENFTESQRNQIWEAYDTIFNHILRNLSTKLDSNVAYWPSSPSSAVKGKYATDKNPDGDVHYWGVWWGKQPFEKYADNIGRFMSEYGFQSFPGLETVRKYALPEDYDIESPVMRHHQRSSIGNVTIKEYMDKYYRTPTSFEKFLYVGQVLQAFGIQYAIEAHRCAMPYNMGSLVWQLNDCWPVASWSSSDYFHRWKALQYQIKNSFEPVLICSLTKNDSTFITIVSDKLKPIHGDLEMKVCNFSGKTLYEKKLEVNIAPNAVTHVIKDKTANFSLHPEETYMLLKFMGSDETIPAKTHFFSKPKDMKLTKPDIKISIEKHGKNFLIHLKTDVLAKNVYLSSENQEGDLTENYFDLLPGVEKNVVFTPKDKMESMPSFKIMSLFDSYQ